MKNKLEKKLISKYVTESYVSELHGLTEQQLKDRLAHLALEREQVSQAKSKDEKLKEVSELKKELEAPYRESTQKVNDISKFIGLLISEKSLEE